MRTFDVVERAVELIVDEVRPNRIIFFGSAARGDAYEDSDVDLLVVVDELRSKHRDLARLNRTLARLPIDVDVALYSQHEVDDWGGVIGHVINEALVDGKVVYDATSAQGCSSSTVGSVF